MQLFENAIRVVFSADRTANVIFKKYVRSKTDQKIIMSIFIGFSNYLRR